MVASDIPSNRAAQTVPRNRAAVLHCGNLTMLKGALDSRGLALHGLGFLQRVLAAYLSKLPFLVRPNYNVCVDLDSDMPASQ